MAKLKKTDTEQSELSKLKAIADELGLSYPNNIGELSLSDKIEVAQKEKAEAAKAQPRTLTDKQLKIMKAKNLRKVKIAVMDPSLVSDTTAFCSCHNMIMDLARYVPLNMEIALEEVLVQDLENRRFVSSKPEMKNGVATGNTVAVEQNTYSVSRL